MSDNADFFLFLAETQAALGHAHARHGRQWPTTDLSTWALILASETGEAVEAVLNHHNGDHGLEAVQKEATHAAAMAFKLWEKARQLIAEGGTP